MTKSLPIFIYFALILAFVFANIFAYPVFFKYTNYTLNDIQKLNNYYETEMYSSNPPKNLDNSAGGTKKDIVVSNLNWFDTVNSQFSVYKKTRVIDIKSGLSYYVYRNGGHNHADVEPIDQENTEIFHKIYSYNYSWARRPVWVEIQPNFWVAASINGYPHGNSYIKDNGMNGHTCIHFLLSKTHGTKRVDEAHQEAVNYAYNHRDEIYKYL